jgi:hypothetical protein
MGPSRSVLTVVVQGLRKDYVFYGLCTASGELAISKDATSPRQL